MSSAPVIQPFRSLADLHLDYARQLNAQQHAAATAPPGPALVIAGAGSGKTRTLVYRVAFLLEQGIPPEHVLLLTFTNKAAREMMERVGQLLGQQVPALWGGTFHSIGNRILRRHADLLGYPRQFTILDREDAQRLLVECRKEAKIAPGELFPKASELADMLSFAANTGKSLEEILDEQYEYDEDDAPRVEALQKQYAERKRATGCLDFDDLLVLWLKLLKEHPDVLEQYQRRFQFILVDEYQDTNKIQGELIDLLAARHRNVMVVGDDSQSIYAWRGAHYQNIFEFPERYPAAATYKIETNYRSTPEILAVANAIMAPSPQRYTKVLVPARKSGEKPVLAACADAREQAAFVAHRLMQLHDEGVGLRKMAVLYRSHFHALELQAELTRCGIPFHLASGISLFQQAHMKDVTAYLKLVQNPRDEVSFKRLVLMLPGVGEKGADKLWRAFEAKRLEGGPTPLPLAASLQACASQLPRKTAAAWAQFSATMAQLEHKDVRDEPADMIRLVRDAGYDDFLREAYANYRNRSEELERLAEYAVGFLSLEEFLSQLALLTNVESEAGQAERAEEDRVQLSTVHQAKGLEFDVVFVIMLGQGMFPSRRSLKNHEDSEEERRLLYVGVTRARDLLFLSYPLLWLSGKGQLESVQPSSFLSEVSGGLAEELGPRGAPSF
jgi:DNA helicase-2/ATP-dependent DNA helicase PcrA